MKDLRKETGVKADVKEKIIVKSLELFKEHGIKSIKMDDIANSLRMSKRTLYEIFTDKGELLEECVLYHQNTYRKAAEEIVANSGNVLEVILKCYQLSLEGYQKINKSFFDDIKKYPKAYRLLKNNKEKDNNEVIDFLKQGVEQGVFRNDINFAIMHTLLSEQMRLLTETDICNSYEFSEVLESIIVIMLRGISTKRGAAELEEFITEHNQKKQQ